MPEIILNTIKPGFMWLSNNNLNKILYAFFILIGPFTIYEAKAQGDWQVDSIKGKTIFFKNGQKFETPLYHLKYIGALASQSKAPYIILSGRDCGSCDAPDEIFIHCPSDGPLSLELSANRFPYPGQEFTRGDSSLIYSGKAFFGMVLFNKPDALIYYQSMKLQDGRMYKNIFIAEVLNDKLHKTLQTEGTVDINETLKLSDLGKCTEIEPKSYLTER